jgi:hypothetical protein
VGFQVTNIKLVLRPGDAGVRTAFGFLLLSTIG